LIFSYTEGIVLDDPSAFQFKMGDYSQMIVEFYAECITFLLPFYDAESRGGSLHEAMFPEFSEGLKGTTAEEP
jgi:hypothetical protein